MISCTRLQFLISQFLSGGFYCSAEKLRANQSNVAILGTAVSFYIHSHRNNLDRQLLHF